MHDQIIHTQSLLAQAANWDIGRIAVAVVVILAIVAIVVIAVQAMKVPVPQWVWQVLGVLLIAAVCILAIRFLLTL